MKGGGRMTECSLKTFKDFEKAITKNSEEFPWDRYDVFKAWKKEREGVVMGVVSIIESVNDVYNKDLGAYEGDAFKLLASSQGDTAGE